MVCFLVGRNLGVTFRLMEMKLDTGTHLSTSIARADGHHMKVFMGQGQDTTSHVSFQCPLLEGAPPTGFN